MRRHQESPLSPSILTSGKVLAAEDSGNVEPPDLPDGLLADDEVPGEPMTFNEDEENGLLDLLADDVERIWN